MTKEIRLNAFDMNCVGHIQHGMWTHPRDRSAEYNTIRYWQDLARLAERGKFDGIFLADIVGVYDVYRGGPAPSSDCRCWRRMPCAAATRFRPMAGAGKGTPIWMSPWNATASHAPWRR